ncbi:MAG: oligosaccharide flippase family protein [Bacteroidales bacterium]|nr:oligosaccharide flippase family protein [Bacteroidales bacterium]
MLNQLKYLKENFKTGTIKQKIVSGTIWLSFGGGVEHAIRLVRNMILTRLLLPESMGAMAIILSVNAAFESFTQIGTKEAVIQNEKGLKNDVLNSAWWLLFLRAVILGLVGILLAPWMALFFKIDNITSLFRLSFLSIILNGTISSGTYAALKRMEYIKWVLYYYGGGFIGVTITILLSLFYRNIHSLVIGYIAEALFRLVLSYILFPFKPSLKITADSIKPLLKFARGIVGLPLLFFIFSRTDIFVLGKMCSKDTVGFYIIAASIAQIPETFIIMILEPLMLPLLSRYKDNKEIVSSVIFKAISLIVYTGIPFLSVCMIYNKDILTCLFGPSYAVMGSTFVILNMVSIVKILNIPFTSAYFAIGRPDYYRSITILRTVILIMIIVPLIYMYKTVGAAIGVFSALAAAFVFQLLHFKKIFQINMKPYIFPMCISILISLPILLPNMIPFHHPIYSQFLMITSFLITFIFQLSLCIKTFLKIRIIEIKK